MRWPVACLFCILSLCVVATALADAVAPARPALLFVVHSYDDDFIWCRNIDRGLQTALRGFPATIRTFHLDAKHDLDPASQRRKALAIASRITEEKPQVVVAVDDAVQELLVVPHLLGRDTPQVVFCGVNAPLARYGYPASNVTGVSERWHVRESLSLLRKIVPTARRVVLLTDGSESSDYMLADIRADLRQGGPYAVEDFSIRQVQTFQQWQKAVLASQEAQGLAFGLYFSLRDEATGSVVPAEAVARWTDTVNRVPTVGFADYVREHGQLCGVLESAHEQGLIAGGMARLLFDPMLRAQTLPLRTNQEGIVFLNLKTAERLGVSVPFEIIQSASEVIQ